MGDSWVENRRKCVPTLAFEALRKQVEADVEELKKLEGAGRVLRFPFDFHKGTSTRFSVEAFANGETRSVHFSLDGSFIKADVHSGREFAPDRIASYSGEFVLGNSGEVRVAVNHSQKRLKPWQFRRKVLEDVFRTKAGAHAS